MTTSSPALARLGITEGTSATRRSPGKVSRGTPTIMKLPPVPNTRTAVGNYKRARRFVRQISTRGQPSAGPDAPKHTLLGAGFVSALARLLFASAPSLYWRPAHPPGSPDQIFFRGAFVLKLRADYRRIEVSLKNGFSKLKFISREQRFPRPREASLPACCSSAPSQDSSQHGAPRLRARTWLCQHRGALPPRHRPFAVRLAAQHL